MPNSDGALIFDMNFENYKKSFEQKLKLYSELSAEHLFLDALAAVIQSNFAMYDQVYRCVDCLHRYNTVMCQIVKSEAGGTTCIYPKSETVKRLVDEKKGLKKKLLLLLMEIQPSYGMVEHLFQMMNSMNSDTKIDSKIDEAMVPEVEQVIKIYEQFDKVFEKFPIKMYRKSLSATRKATKLFQSGSFTRAEANECLTVNVPKAFEIRPILEEVVDIALEIDYNHLFEATKKVHGIVMKALNVEEASASNSDKKGKWQDLESFCNFFKISSIINEAIL